MTRFQVGAPLSFENLTRRQRWLYGSKQTIGLGFLAGSLEVTSMTARLKLSLSMVEFCSLGLVALVVMGVFSYTLGLVTGFTQNLKREERFSRGLALHLSAASLLLTGFYLWQGAVGLWWEQRQIAACAMAVLPLGFSSVVFYNAVYWFRKLEIGASYRVSWNVAAFAFSMVVVVIAGVVFNSRASVGQQALEGDKNVVVITIDTLRHDHVGLEVDGVSITPNMDRLAVRGIRFTNAVTPMPETAPAHSSMFTGLHPLRHKVLSNGHKLSRGYQTIAEVLQGEGYSTGAFVSSFAVDSEVGLDQGFSVYDDDFTPYISGFTRINLVRKLVTAWMVLGEPARTPWLFERDGETTVSQFKKWLPAQSGDPFFAWVHLFEPHAPYDALEGGIDHRLRMGDNFTDQEREQLRGQYLDEVRRVDGYIGQIIETLDSRELSDNTLVILVADHGEMLGEHGYMFNHFSLYDEVVRVPMIVVAPGLHFKKTTVDTQVRLMDLPATILDYLQIDAMEETEGVELIGYAEGHRKATMWCSLIGREGRSGDLLVGLRNNGVKYIRTLSGGAEQLFNVEEDSVESSNIVDEQAATLEQARRLVSSEARALEVLSREAKPTALDARSMLKALGYTQ